MNECNFNAKHVQYLGAKLVTIQYQSPRNKLQASYLADHCNITSFQTAFKSQLSIDNLSHLHL